MNTRLLFAAIPKGFVKCSVAALQIVCNYYKLDKRAKDGLSLSAVFNLRFVRLEVEMAGLPERVDEGVKASTLRGAFGRALRLVSCVKPQRESCSGCALAQTCAYSYIFETPPKTSWRQYPFYPHPFVLTYLPSEPNKFYVTLLGAGVNYAEWVLAAIEEMGKSGLGRERRKFSPVVRWKGEVVFKGGKVLAQIRPITLGSYVLERGDFEVIQVNFPILARIVHKGKLLRSFSAEGFFASLFRRLWLLNQIHGENADFPDYKSELSKVKVLKNNTFPAQHENWSSRQKKVLRLQGFRGAVELEVPAGLLRSALFAGEVIHVGKGTSFGFGKYETKEVLS